MTSRLAASSALDRRLRPLHWAVFLEGIAPWLPVEKVFMTQLGFTPALVALMATAYGAVVPLLQIPSGVLADRWSRRGVLMLAGVASLASVLVGGLSHSVPMYIVSAMILGVYFALQSGTVDSIVYDTLIEELGSADDFEKRYGRVQMLQSAALTASAIAGGVIASLASARVTYFVTIPTCVAGVVVLTRFREPTLHRTHESSRLRDHLGATVQTLRDHPRLATVGLAMALGSAALQMVFEFGPLWLVAAAAPAFVFGPYTAGLTSALGAAGGLAGRLQLSCRRRATAAGVAMTVGALTLTVDAPLGATIAAQIVLVALLAAVGIHLSKLLHDAVPATVRTAVSSGVGTLSWLAFLPASMLFGALGTRSVYVAGWVVVVPVAVASISVVCLAHRPATSRCTAPAAVPQPA